MVIEKHDADAGPAGTQQVIITPRHVRGWGLRLITVIGAVLALVFAGMGQAVAYQPGSVKPSATDARWAAMMVDHHRNGIELTDLALQKSRNPGVRGVAADSKRDQQSELPQLLEVAKAGGLGPMPPEPPLRRFSDQEMQKLRSLSGAEFDRMWLDVLSSHHMAAIMMSDVALAGTAGGKAQQLQRQIVDGQLRQVARMNDLRGRD